MTSIKALFIGVASMLFLGLMFELIFLFVDIGYNLLMQTFPAIKSVKQGFNYVFIAAGLFFVMFSGGYLTSVYAKTHTAIHSMVAALITSGIALYSTSGGYEFTLMSVLFVVLSIAFSLYGNRMFRNSNTDAVEDISA